MSVLAVAGWALAAALGAWSWRLRRRLELVARAGHELRGPATAISLAAASLRREPGGLGRALTFEGEIARLRLALADLDAARSGRRVAARPGPLALERALRETAAGWRPAARAQGRRLTLRWEAGPVVVHADRRRLSQALGNLLANAVEHGGGDLELRGLRSAGGVRVEVRDGGGGGGGGRAGGRDRGRGLAIAGAAVEEAGGSLTLERGPGGAVAAVELPVTEP